MGLLNQNRRGGILADPMDGYRGLLGRVQQAQSVPNTGIPGIARGIQKREFDAESDAESWTRSNDKQLCPRCTDFGLESVLMSLFVCFAREVLQ